MLHTKILEATISGWVGLWYSRVGPGRAGLIMPTVNRAGSKL